MIIYGVYHIYDVDGGFGDAIGEESLIETFLNKNDAETFVQKYSDPHCYDNPLEIREIEVKKCFDLNSYDNKKMWWLTTCYCDVCSVKDCEERRSVNDLP